MLGCPIAGIHRSTDRFSLLDILAWNEWHNSNRYSLPRGRGRACGALFWSPSLTTSSSLGCVICEWTCAVWAATAAFCFGLFVVNRYRSLSAAACHDSDAVGNCSFADTGVYVTVGRLLLNRWARKCGSKLLCRRMTDEDIIFPLFNKYHIPLSYATK